MDDSWREEQGGYDIKEDEEIDISDPGRNISEDIVVTKYKMAGEIVNRVLKKVVEKCIAHESVRNICEYGDKLLTEETGKVFKRQIKKGIAFPTSVSVNNCIRHFSPTHSERDQVLKTGDMVKVELGGHVDGFIAVAGHTVVIGASVDNKVTGRKADVLLAAHYASEAALRLLAPGNSTYDVTDIVQKTTNLYNCRPVGGMLSFQLKQNCINSGKRIILNPQDEQRKLLPKFDIETHEVYALNVVVSTGDGSSREMEARTTIYKKLDDQYYQLKLKCSRIFINEIVNKYGRMPFNIRGLENENKARLGIIECVKHNIIEPFSVSYEKPGEYVAQFMFTVLLMPAGLHQITGLPIDVNQFETEYDYKRDQSLNLLLNKSINLKTVKRRKKKLIAKGIARGAGVAVKT